MTNDTKVKPDGWVFKHWQKRTELRTINIARNPHPNDKPQMMPVCLVSPAEKQQFEELKAWIKKLRQYKGEQSPGDFEDRVYQLLEELDRFLPEPTT